jgi:predicted nuclease of restriction endonuclease-like RecB superfamily
MLTRALAIARRENGRVTPDRLTSATHAIYPELARRMLAIYGDGIHKTRNDLHQSIVDILEEDPHCPVRRMGAFCKLLDAYGRFDRGKPKRAAELRHRVFAMAAKFHPLVSKSESLLDQSEMAIKQRIAQSLGMEWPELRLRLYEDLIDQHRLQSFAGPSDPIELLSRYNVAQTQAALLDAISIRIDATSDWKMILRYAKLAGLMHTIVASAHGYRIDLDGPASILRQTHRYGASMAKFLPGLLACRGWSMTATMRSRCASTSNRDPAGPVLELNDRSGLRSNVAAADPLDSEIERNWVEAWGTQPRLGWTLIREGEILVRGQRVFIPDFALVHARGYRVLLEIAAFWTPQYIRHRSETLSLFAEIPILVAIPRATAALWNEPPWPSLHQKIVFGRQLRPEQVLEVLEGMSLGTERLG